MMPALAPLTSFQTWQGLRGAAIGGLIISLVSATTADAAGLIRDAETESLLKAYSKPIFGAAGLTAQGVDIHIVNDRAFNAFVVDGHNMFVHAGALMDAKTPNQIIGVIAHECGHITGGHLARLRGQVAKAKSAALMLQIIGLAAMAAGAAVGAGGIGAAGMGAAYGGTDAAVRMVLAYQQDEESSADQAAVTFLNATKQSGRGLLETLEFMNSKLIGIQGINPYLQSHPLPPQRLAQLRNLVTSSPYYDVKDPPELQMRHDLVRAKLFGFLDEPETIFNRYPQSDQSLPANYARAIATYRFADSHAAAAQIDALIAAQPQNPYFHELKGQMLLESGRPAEAIGPLRQAAQLAPNPALIQIMLGQALVASNNHAHTEEAVSILQAAVLREPESSDGYTQLAMAYAQKNDLARADLASAQAAFMRGDIKTAREIAARAKTRFPVGSPGWVKADDISSYKPPQRSALRPQ